MIFRVQENLGRVLRRNTKITDLAKSLWRKTILPMHFKSMSFTSWHNKFLYLYVDKHQFTIYKSINMQPFWNFNGLFAWTISAPDVQSQRRMFNTGSKRLNVFGTMRKCKLSQLANYMTFMGMLTNSPLIIELFCFYLSKLSKFVQVLCKAVIL